MSDEERVIAGLKIHIQIIGGKAPSLSDTVARSSPILILHGWGSRGDRWLQTAKVLANKGFQVIIPDLPGFGNSQQPSFPWDLNQYCQFISALVEELGLEKFYLLGHSFGGALAVKYSLQYPHKIEKLFLIAAACVRAQSARKKIFFAIAKIFKVFSFLPFYGSARKAFYKFIVRKTDYLASNGIMKQTYLNIIQEDLSPLVHLTQTPTVIIWGNQDSATPLRHGQFLHEQIKNSAFIVIKGANHDLERKIPVVLAEKIFAQLL